MTSIEEPQGAAQPRSDRPGDIPAERPACASNTPAVPPVSSSERRDSCRDIEIS